MNVNDLKRGRFLTQKDIEKPVIVTIAGVAEFNVALEGVEPDMRWALNFREFDKPFILNSTNGQIIAAIIGSEESDDWIGYQIVLYTDPSITFRGKLVGGIRVRAPKSQAAPLPKPQTFDRAKSIAALRAAQKAVGQVPVNEPDPSIVEEPYEPGADDEV